MADRHEPKFGLPAGSDTTIYNGYIEAPVKNQDEAFFIPTLENSSGQNFRVHLMPVWTGGGRCIVQRAEVVPVNDGLSVNYCIDLTENTAELAGLGYILFAN